MRLSSWSELRQTIPIACIGMACFYILYGYSSWLTASNPPSLSLTSKFDNLIPFYPCWSVIYLSINLLLPLSLFIFHTRNEISKYVMTVIAQVLVACVFFILLPTDHPFGNKTSSDNIFYQWADIINLEYNYFPSLHVALAISSSVIFGRNIDNKFSNIFYLWGFLISISTLFMHEHNVSDVLGGFILALFGLYLYSRMT